MRAVVDFGRSWLTRFVEVQGIDRAMAIAAQAFSALIPILIVYSAIVPSPKGKSSFADSVIERFELDGAAAETVRQAFTSSQTVEDSVSIIGLVLLLISALAFSRGMQRLYEGAYRLPALGMRGTRTGLLWLALIGVYSSVAPWLSDVFSGGLLGSAVTITLAGFIWTITPYLLLGRRMRWQELLPGAALAAVGMTALGAASVIWLPHTFATSADQFGAMGVAFALLSWLVAAAFVLVVTATGGAATLDWMEGKRP